MSNDKPLQIAAFLQAAIQEHQCGELAKAEARYRHILNMDVMHPDANHNLGILALQTNQLAVALHHLEMALLSKREQQQYVVSYLNLLLHANETAAAQEWLQASGLSSSPHSELADFSKCLQERANAGKSPYFSSEEFFPTDTVSVSDKSHQQLLNKRINHLHQTHRFAELESLCHFTIARNQHTEDAWIALGAALFEQSKPALEICQKAAQLYPDNSAAHANLGAAQTRAGLAADAIISNQRAITLKPDHAQAHYNLANCFKAEARYEEAIHHYRLAISNQPDLHSAHHNLGLCLKAQGQFDEALLVFRHALQMQFESKKTAPFPQQQAATHQVARQPINQEIARRVLASLCKQFEQANIPCCLFAGTLLGIYRNGDILPYDKDLDLAIPAQVDRQHVIDAIASSTEFQVILSFGTEEEKRWRDSMSLFHAESGISIDLFFLHEDGEEHFLAGAFHPVQSILCRLPRFTFTPHVWRDQSWLIPNDPERYLEAVYGRQWRIPDTQFDTVISNPTRIQAAIPVVLCYAYSHLFHALKTSNWKRAYFLSLQTNALQNDELLEELCAWIGQHQQTYNNKNNE